MRILYHSDITNQDYKSSAECASAEFKAIAENNKKRREFDAIKKGAEKRDAELEKERRVADKAKARLRLIDILRERDALTKKLSEAFDAYADFDESDAICLLLGSLKDAFKGFLNDEDEDE